MEWPELLRRYTEALRQYAIWQEGGCVGAPPASVDPSGVRGPVPPELRAYATELVAQVRAMESTIAGQLVALRARAGHAHTSRPRYEDRPMPRYLDALG